MSIRIIKKGILDTIQDKGRVGYQHMGIGSGGAMDQIALTLANALLCNDDGEAVIEMHFPAASLLFEKPCIVVLTGAHFDATINEYPIDLYQPFLVQSGTILKFKKCYAGARVYLAVKGGFDLTPWLNSCSTHLKAKAGGFEGRALLNGDLIPFKKEIDSNTESIRSYDLIDLKGWVKQVYSKNSIPFVVGKEYALLSDTSIKTLLTEQFTIMPQSDRMGYRLSGSTLIPVKNIEMLSSGVTKGTIQLIPLGQLIILMADCQTTGGYPVIGHIATVAMHRLAQYQFNETIQFNVITHQEAHLLYIAQQKELNQWKEKCKLLID